MRLADSPFSMNTGMILERLYRFPLHRKSLRSRLRGLVHGTTAWVRDRASMLSVGSIVFAAWLVGHVYYYNRLVLLESDVTCARAQIDAVEQKRHHIQVNLTRLLRYYAQYERTVLDETTKMRTAKGVPDAAEASPSLTDLLARLNAVAEQYPNLNLGKNVQQMSDSIMQSEDEIAKRIMAYDEAVNTYTNLLGTFPGNVFGKVLRFKDYQYYEPEDRSDLRFREVQP